MCCTWLSNLQLLSWRRKAVYIHVSMQQMMQDPLGDKEQLAPSRTRRTLKLIHSTGAGHREGRGGHGRLTSRTSYLRSLLLRYKPTDWPLLDSILALPYSLIPGNPKNATKPTPALTATDRTRCHPHREDPDNTALTRSH